MNSLQLCDYHIRVWELMYYIQDRIILLGPSMVKSCLISFASTGNWNIVKQLPKALLWSISILPKIWTISDTYENKFKILSGHKFTPPTVLTFSTPFSDKSSLSSHFLLFLLYLFCSSCSLYRKKHLFCFKALWCCFLSDVIHFPSARTDAFIL